MPFELLANHASNLQKAIAFKIESDARAVAKARARVSLLISSTASILNEVPFISTEIYGLHLDKMTVNIRNGATVYVESGVPNADGAVLLFQGPNHSSRMLYSSSTESWSVKGIQHLKSEEDMVEHRILTALGVLGA